MKSLISLTTLVFRLCVAIQIPLAEAGCGADRTATPATSEVVPTSEDHPPTKAGDSPQSLQGTTWIITGSAFAQTMPDEPPRFTVDSEHLRLTAPCNVYTTRAEVGAGQLRLFPFENMPRTCGLEPMEIEGALLRSLGRVTAYALTPDGDLVLTAVDGTEMIRARPSTGG